MRDNYFIGTDLKFAITLTADGFNMDDDNYSIVVVDYIPVRVGQVGYMYDRISGKLYGKYATCTTDFVLGNDKT
jgi:hypothetical protein